MKNKTQKQNGDCLTSLGIFHVLRLFVALVQYTTSYPSQIYVLTLILIGHPEIVESHLL